MKYSDSGALGGTSTNTAVPPPTGLEVISATVRSMSLKRSIGSGTGSWPSHTTNSGWVRRTPPAPAVTAMRDRYMPVASGW